MNNPQNNNKLVEELTAEQVADHIGVTPYSDMRPFVVQAVKYAREKDAAGARIPALEALLDKSVEALDLFAGVADLVDIETEGFSDTDTFELMFEDHLFDRFTLAHFRAARSTLTAIKEARHAGN